MNDRKPDMEPADWFLIVVYVLAAIVVCMDSFVWRA